MKYKNYYKILELQNEKASLEEIKSAYRRLAKKYHPDINPGNMMIAERFKEINEAYQVLSDENAKKKYDRIHFAYKIKNGFSIEEVKEKVDPVGGASTFWSTFFGNGKPNVVSNLDKNKKEIPIQGEDLESEIEATLEEGFYGTEKKIAFRTVDNKMKTIQVKIPQGIRDGEKIRLADQGKPGIHGGPNGDLYIRIKLIKDARFQLDGSDLKVELPLTPWEAALGCKLEVFSIDCSALVTIPAGIESGERLRIANIGYKDGYGGRGDLLAEVKIVVPKSLTKEEKSLFEKMKQISKFSPRNN